MGFHMITEMQRSNNVKFTEEKLKKNCSLKKVNVISWENFVVAIAFIADCHTYVREYNIQNFAVQPQRDKMIDVFLRLLKFKWI